MGQQLPGVWTPATAGGRGDPKGLISSGPAHYPSQGAGQARGGQTGAAPVPGIVNLHGDIAGPSPGWDISLKAGVRIRPCEGNRGQTQPRDGWAEP